MVMYTTDNVPKTIKRSTREKQDCDSTLIEEWVWSNWVLAMTPGQHGDFRQRSTREHVRSGYKISKDALERAFALSRRKFSCGIYEWKARSIRTNKEYVVYIGSTCRGKNGNFVERIYEYCNNGSHKADYINDALQKGYQLWVRFKGSGDDGIAHDRNKARAEDDENTVLKYYDYAWNIRTAKQIVRTVP